MRGLIPSRGPGGGSAAQAGRGHSLGVTVVSASSELVYRPWLVYLPAGKLDPQALRLPMAQVARRGGFAFHHGEVGELRRDDDLVVLAGGQTIDYRCVVVAAGAPADRARIPGAARHALFPCQQAATVAANVGALLADPVLGTA